ncbi:hypothetical protein L1987_08235 [Smallanthus sonchifolius]|uniref:Uncharacterized protein n=1 Tax=Smallanthus sonchifolius TaxID=185202 RepID=A0ACB9JK29_9ASTR|nr:hypothetical protein L1987_08235 [Smallanthus sonchifolius]
MAAASSSPSLVDSLSSLSLSSLETPPPPPPTSVSLLSASAASDSLSMKALTISQPLITPVIRETSHDIQSVLFPSLAFSNTLFFKTPYNVQVIVNPDESEESLIGRFRREVFRENIIQECKRRRFFETNQEKRKRKIRDAARRRSRRRQRPVAKKDDTPRKKVVDDEPDNWDLIDIEVPYC